MGKGHGFGKAILFNEHFVVYGVPAIVSAINYRTIARVEKSDKEALEDRRKGTAGYSQAKMAQQIEAVKIIKSAMGIEENLRIILEGDLPAFSGIGASAANSVAIARAISDEFNLSLGDDEINSIAYMAEKAFAGTPSGVDNTAATYGGLIWFRRSADPLSEEPPFVERIKAEPFEMVLANSGVVADTKKVIEGVRDRREKYREEYDRIFFEADTIAHRARKALETKNLREVGELMNRNHSLLKEIEVSSDILDRMVGIALKAGALGAKVTGGGVGGCMLSLTPGKELQKRVEDALKREGFETLRLEVGGE
jgi:mevalonate kinase